MRRQVCENKCKVEWLLVPAPHPGDQLPCPHTFSLPAHLLTEFLEDPKAVFKEIYRVLRVGGSCHVVFTSKNTYKGYEEKQVSFWGDMNDAQHMYVVGSYFQFSAGGWSQLKGYDITDEKTKNSNRFLNMVRTRRNGFQKRAPSNLKQTALLPSPVARARRLAVKPPIHIYSPTETTHRLIDTTPGRRRFQVCQPLRGLEYACGEARRGGGPSAPHAGKAARASLTAIILFQIPPLNGHHLGPRIRKCLPTRFRKCRLLAPLTTHKIGNGVYAWRDAWRV